MLQTLFYIPDMLFGLPLFGFGLLLAVWAVASVVILAWQLSRHGVNEETLGFVPLLALIGAAILWLLPALLEHRPSGEVRGLPIRGYGVMLLLGVVAAVALAVRLAKKRGFDPEMIYSLALWLLGGGIIGARLFYVIEYWDVQFLQHTEDGGVNIWGTLAAVANVAQGGLVVYGSFVGGAISTIWFLRRNRLPVLQMCDLVAPGVMLGLAIGRIGCFLNGCCFGGVSDVPWAVEFPISSPPAKRQMNRARTLFARTGVQGDPNRTFPAVPQSSVPCNLVRPPTKRGSSRTIESFRTIGSRHPMEELRSNSFPPNDPSERRNRRPCTTNLRTPLKWRCWAFRAKGQSSLSKPRTRPNRRPGRSRAPMSRRFAAARFNRRSFTARSTPCCSASFYWRTSHSAVTTARRSP